MDKIISKIAALGVPGVVLIVALHATGYAGAAAMTTVLAAMGGPAGMIGGVFAFAAMALISDAIVKYGYSAVMNAVLKELYKKGETKETILAKVETYPISNDLKRKLRENVEAF